MSDIVRIEGLRNLHLNFDRVSREILQEADEGLKRGGMKIIASSQMNLRRNGTNNTGLLSNSGKVQKIEGGDGYDVGFFAKDAGYAEFVEYGRRAGRFPPLDIIQAWVKKKLRIDKEKFQKSIAFLIGRKIAKKGTVPHPFFTPAVSENEKEIVSCIEEAVNRVTRRINNV